MATQIDEIPHILVVHGKDDTDIEHLSTCDRMSHKIGSFDVEDYGCGVGADIAWWGYDNVVDTEGEPVDVSKLKPGRYELRFSQSSPDAFGNGDWETELILSPEKTEE